MAKNENQDENTNDYASRDELLVQVLSTKTALNQLMDTLSNSTTDCQEIKLVLRQTDCLSRLMILEAVLIGLESVDAVSGIGAHGLCLGLTRNVVEDIEYIVKQINNKVTEVSRAWLAIWRSVPAEKFANALQRLDHILEKRMDMLLKVLAVPCCGKQNGTVNSLEDKPIESTFIREQRRLQQKAALRDQAAYKTFISTKAPTAA